MSDILPEQNIKKHWWKKWWVWLIIIVIIWLVIASLLQVITPNQSTNSSSGFTNIPGANSNTNKNTVNINTTNDPWLGFAEAPITIVEFADFECPFTREAVPIIQQVLKKYPEAVRLIYKDFPIAEIHSQAVAAAEAANCAQKQNKFWQYHDQLFNQGDRLNSTLYDSIANSLGLNQVDFKRCMEGHLTLSKVQSDYSAGVEAGVSGTPTWFVNGHKIEGALSLSMWDKVIAAALKDKFKR